MRFESLPAELQIEVFNNLNNSDLKAARAVSRKFRDNASPALFRYVVACARYVAMGSFQSISLNPVLRKYVKTIIFDGSVYNAAISSQVELYESQNNRYDDLRTSSFWGLRTRWKRYQELYKEQVDLNASGVLLHTIARALEWTTNVSSVIYSPHPHLLTSEKKLMKDLLPRDSSSSEVPLHDGRIGLFGPSTHPFRQLIGAIHLTGFTGIRELRVLPFDERKPGTPFTFDFFSFPDTSDIRASRSLFQNLTFLELHIRILPAHDSTRIRSKHQGRQALAYLSHSLAATNDLRNLTLHVVGWDPRKESAPQLELGPRAPVFSRLGLRKTWPKLRSLSLGGIHSISDDFLDFIRRHRDTVQSLSFQDCCLYAGTWAEIVDEVLYSSSVFSFVLDSVTETQVPADNDALMSSAELDEWKYEGRIEVTKDGERKFVESVPAKRSVYFRTM